MEVFMADQLQDFLVTLATDSGKLGEFIRDPEASMQAAELDDDDRGALRSGNPSAIYGRLTGQGGFAPVYAPPNVVVVVDLYALGDQRIPVIRQGTSHQLSGQAGIVYAAPVYAQPQPV